MDNRYLEILIEDIEKCIRSETDFGYDAGNLITLQTLLMHNYTRITDHYYLNDINIDDCIALKWAIRDMIRKISWSLYHGSYREMMWIEEFHKSYE